MIVKGTQQLGLFKRGINLYVPKRALLPTNTVWTFETPTAGGTITSFSVSTTIGTITINWGDNTSNTINSNTLVNKTY